MKKIMRICLLFFVLVSFAFEKDVLSWDNDVTHRDLSSFAAQNSVLSKTKGDYLKNIGFNKELLEEFTWNNKKRTVEDWLREGAFLEDSVVWHELITNRGRFNNHFHNPLKLWSSAGLDDYLTIPIPLPPYTYTHHVYGLSSILWAQDSDYQASFREGDQSWKKIREHYYTALTGRDFSASGVAPTKEKRDEYFARTFSGLGHQIHLIQDAAQPDHVRNDTHVEDSLLGNQYLIGPSYFETWAKRNPSIINSFASKAPDFMPQVSLNTPQYGLVPITQFIDAEQYNTGSVPSTSLTWGISEYTNSNFVSDNTIFTENFNQSNRNYFPYPRYSTQCYELYDKDIGANKKRTYLKKKCEGETVERFAAPGPFYKYLGFFAPSLQRLDLILDEGVHYDYAEKLIPRAVGYSAGLLNYFFRGEMDMVPDEETGDGYVIVNNTDEDMSGQFELWYDNKDDERVKVSGASWTLNINKKSSGNNKSTNIDFTPPTDAKEPGKYMLVFKGKLGNEEDAVVGKEISLIPLLIFLHNGQNTLFMSFDKDLKLTPYPPFILTLGNAGLGGIETTPATIQSNETYTEHYYMPSTTQNTSWTGYPENYGRRTYSYLLGNRNSFTPIGWDKKSPLQYNNDLSYLSYPDNYICSGRRNWIYDSSGNVIKNLEVWKTNTKTATIKYITKDGEQQGRQFNYNDWDIYAVISPNKIIGKGPKGNPTNTVAFQSVPLVYCDINYSASATDYVYYDDGGKVYFGNIAFDNYGVNSETISTYTGVGQCSTWCGANQGVRDYVENHVVETYYSTGEGFQDYDNINEDKTFIMIYSKQGYRRKDKTIETTYYYDGNSYYSRRGFEEERWAGTVKEFKIAYRLRGGDIKNISVCEQGYEGGYAQLFGGHFRCEFYGGPNLPRVRYPTEFRGQAMFNPSSKIFDFNSKTYIAYSYSIYDYIGDPKVANFDSELLSDWRFNKRIVGFIDADTGQKTETEITDAFLGDMYKDKFDKTLYSAIGFHNGSVKK